MRIRFALAFVFSACLIGSATAQKEWARYRVTVPDAAAAQRITDSALGLFSEEVTLGETDLIVRPGELPLLRQLHLPFKKVQTLPPGDAWKNQGLGDGGPPDYRFNYLRYEQIVAQYEIWRAQYPYLIQRQQIGTTWNGQAVWVYKLHYPSSIPNTKIVTLQCGIHAREWISPPVGMYIFEQMLRGCLNSAQGFFLLSTFELDVVPSMNPDGYIFSWDSDRYWRKNRRNNGGGVYGVDLNRNYSKAWGGQGSSGSPSSETYRGPSAFSEPETRAIRDYMASRTGHSGFIDYHSYAQKILYPWSYTTNPAPTASLLDSIANSYRIALINSGGATYTSGQASVILYIASGTSKDWAYDLYGIPAFTVEMRDTGNFGFVLPADQILPTAQENWAGFKAYLQRLLP
jgi:murein tripeptide amidase MpaA